MNSNIDLARKTGAGVHLPELGPSIDCRSGTSRGRCAYWALGALAGSRRCVRGGEPTLLPGMFSKQDRRWGSPPIGVERFAEIVAAAPAPVLAIGGVTPQRVATSSSTWRGRSRGTDPFTHLDTIGAAASSYRKALEQIVSEQNANRRFERRSTANRRTYRREPRSRRFFAGRELHERLVVVERNGEIIKRAAFLEVTLEEGDLIEIVHFVGGG